jgi:hydrogenase maturation factor HypF (carbamoyltransferase family)
MPEDYAGEHELVLKEAQSIYVSRSKMRGQMWLDSSIERELNMIDEKLKRAQEAHNHFIQDDPDMMKEFEDSLLDLINFAAFALRKARRGYEA